MSPALVAHKPRPHLSFYLSCFVLLLLYIRVILVEVCGCFLLIFKQRIAYSSIKRLSGLYFFSVSWFAAILFPALNYLSGLLKLMPNIHMRQSYWSKYLSDLFFHCVSEEDHEQTIVKTKKCLGKLKQSARLACLCGRKFYWGFLLMLWMQLVSIFDTFLTLIAMFIFYSLSGMHFELLLQWHVIKGNAKITIL